MKSLNEEQITLAAERYYESCVRMGDPLAANFVTITGALREIAPLLQMPWDEPTGEEVYAGANTSMIQMAIANFVRMRNAALHPKLVDPRVEALREALVAVRRSNAMSTQADFDKATAYILRMLDERGVSLDEEE